MGTKIDDPGPGAECGHWDPPAETPLTIFAMFWEVQKGGRFQARQPPNGHLFKLVQDDPLVCQWKSANLTHGWEVTFSIQAAAMSVDLRDATLRDRVYFVDNVDHSPPGDYELFTNELVNPPMEFGYNGNCIVYMLPVIRALAEAFGLDQFDDLFFETFFVNVTEFVVKFCSLTAGTNVSLKISP